MSSELSTAFQPLNIKGDTTELNIKIDKIMICPKLKSGRDGFLPVLKSDKTTNIACHNKKSLNEWKKYPQDALKRVLNSG